MCNQLQFADERPGVPFYQFAAARFRIERAIGTFVRAERHMDIEAGNGWVGLKRHRVNLGVLRSKIEQKCYVGRVRWTLTALGPLSPLTSSKFTSSPS